MSAKYKELITYHKNGSALYSLKFVGGGQLPDVLQSEYTSTSEAERWKKLYYSGKLPKKIRPIEAISELKEAS